MVLTRLIDDAKISLCVFKPLVDLICLYYVVPTNMPQLLEFISLKHRLVFSILRLALINLKDSVKNAYACTACD